MNSSTFAASRGNRQCLGVLGAAAAAGVLMACQAAAPPPAAPVSPDTWAVVNGGEITRDEVEKAFRQAGDGAQTLSGDEALTAKLGVLDELIVQEILLAKARELKLEIPDSEVDSAFSEARQNISDESFQQELTKRSLTAADMRDGLRRDLLARKVIEQEVGSKVAVTDQEVSAFFEANRAQFNLAEDAYRLAQIVVTPVRDPEVANRTRDDATTPQAAAAKVAMLMERLKEGAPFQELALDYSEDPQSTPRGGDLGLIPVSAVKQASPALRDAVLKGEPGSARVVNDPRGYTIVFVAGLERAGQRDLSMPPVRERITETLRAQKEQLLRTAYLAAARTDAEVTNYLARRVVESQGQAAAPQAPLVK